MRLSAALFPSAQRLGLFPEAAESQTWPGEEPVARIIPVQRDGVRLSERVELN